MLCNRIKLEGYLKKGIVNENNFRFFNLICTKSYSFNLNQEAKIKEWIQVNL